jgi:hypothetical protein
MREQKDVFDNIFEAGCLFTHNLHVFDPLTHRAIKVAFIFLKTQEKTKIIEIKVEGSNRQ